MQLSNFAYLSILMGSLAVPLALSFEKKMRFYKKFGQLFPAILITAIVFIIWDIQFSKAEIWTFNPKYTLGLNLAGMPIEEWLFFFVVPYCCTFIYEVLKFYIKQPEQTRIYQTVSILLCVVFVFVGFIFRQYTYTFTCFLFAGIYLIYITIRNKFRPHLAHFYLTYLVSLIPFILVNGLLTALPIVEYNTRNTLNIRILSIPIEDFAYLFLMLLIEFTIFEALKARAGKMTK